MNNDNRIEIAKKFISKHKQDDVYYWTPTGEPDDMKFLFIYSMLMKGGFGEVRVLDNEYDEYGDIVKHGSKLECVITQNLSITDEPYYFTWEDCRHQLFAAIE